MLQLFGEIGFSSSTSDDLKVILIIFSKVDEKKSKSLSNGGKHVIGFK